MKKRNKRLIAVAMVAVMVGTVCVGLNSKKILKSSADEPATQIMTIKECGKKYSAVNYLTRGIDVYTAGSPMFNVGEINSSAINVKANRIFSNNNSEYATDNWKVKVEEQSMHNYKSADNTNFANYIEEYSSKISTESKLSAEASAMCKGDYEACVKLAKEANKANNVYTYYRTVRTSLVTGNIELDDNQEAKHNMTKEFKGDVFRLLDANSGVDIDTIVERYGTYFVNKVQLGGRLQLNYAICSNNAEESESLTKEVNAAVNAKLNFDKNDKTQDNVKKDNQENNDFSDDGQEVIKEEDLSPKASAIFKFLCGKDKSSSAKFGAVTVIKEIYSVGPRYNGDVEKWYEEAEKKPQCIGVDGIAEIETVVEYLTESNTGHSKKEIEQVKNILNKGLGDYKKKIKKQQEEEAAEIQKQSKNQNGFNITTEIIEPVSGPIAYREKTEFSNQAVLEEGIQKLHNGYKIGEMIVTNKLTKDKTTGCYNYSDLGRMKISFTASENINNLPIGDTSATSHILTSSGTNISYIFGKLNLLGIRNGAYYVQAEYRDGTNGFIAQDTNIFKDVYPGKNINLCSFSPNTVSEAMSRGGIAKLNINLLYNTTATYGSKKNKCSQDWKTVYTIDFNK